mgnify:CR=1 FL=1
MTHKVMKIVAPLLAGILFGLGLLVSGMTNPEKVRGFLDLFGNWQPALMAVMVSAIAVFAVIRFAAFSNNDDTIPVILYISAGIAAWTYFDFVVNNSASAIINSGSMIKKIYFPRLILPLSKALVGLIDYLIGLLILVIMFMAYGVIPSSNFIFLPLFILSTIMAALGLGVWVSALTIRFRDFQHIVPFMLKIGMFITQWKI